MKEEQMTLKKALWNRTGLSLLFSILLVIGIILTPNKYIIIASIIVFLIVVIVGSIIFNGKIGWFLK